MLSTIVIGGFICAAAYSVQSKMGASARQKTLAAEPIILHADETPDTGEGDLIAYTAI